MISIYQTKNIYNLLKNKLLVMTYPLNLGLNYIFVSNFKLKLRAIIIIALIPIYNLQDSKSFNIFFSIKITLQNGPLSILYVFGKFARFFYFVPNIKRPNRKHVMHFTMASPFFAVFNSCKGTKSKHQFHEMIIKIVLIHQVILESLN